MSSDAREVLSEPGLQRGPASPRIVAKNRVTTFFTTRSLNFWLWTAVLALGLVQAAANRYSIFSDGISYLDLSDAYRHGDWHNAINGQWSPLYPILLAVTFSILRPSAYYEAPVAHLVMLFLYIACFASLQLLVREIQQRNSLSEQVSRQGGFSDSQFKVLACLFFLLMAQDYNTARDASVPDLLVVLIIFLASTLILRISRTGANWRRAIGLGVVLGFGYLAKAVMFPLAPVFMATAILRRESFKKLLAETAVCLVAFGLVAGPYIYALSRNKHRFTFSDVGNLN